MQLRRMHCGHADDELHSLKIKSHSCTHETHDAVPVLSLLLRLRPVLSLPPAVPNLIPASMRTNDKTLTRLSGSPDHSGPLFMRGEVGRSFQRRWCCLRGNLFFYFEKKCDREPVGCVVLEGCHMELSDPESGLFAFKIAFTGPGRTYVLAAESQSELEQWVRLLSRAHYDFLKFTAVELDGRLRDLRAAAAGRASAPARPARSAELQRHPVPTRCPFSRRPFRDVHLHYGRHWVRDGDQDRGRGEESGTRPAGTGCGTSGSGETVPERL